MSINQFCFISEQLFLLSISSIGIEIIRKYSRHRKAQYFSDDVDSSHGCFERENGTKTFLFVMNRRRRENI